MPHRRDFHAIHHMHSEYEPCALMTCPKSILRMVVATRIALRGPHSGPYAGIETILSMIVAIR